MQFQVEFASSKSAARTVQSCEFSWSGSPVVGRSKAAVKDAIQKAFDGEPDRPIVLLFDTDRGTATAI